VGATGRRLLRQEVLSNPNATFSSIRLTRNSGFSDYHAGQIQFQRRLSRGLQALASYTWSHSLDNVSSEVSGEAPEFLIDVTRERGPSDFDVRHSFTGAASYDLPSPADNYLKALFGGFSLDAMFIARSAFPVNVITGANAIQGNGVSRPDLVTNVPLYIDDPLAPAAGESIDLLSPSQLAGKELWAAMRCTTFPCGSSICRCDDSSNSQSAGNFS
jgi:hypothetical protein